MRRLVSSRFPSFSGWKASHCTLWQEPQSPPFAAPILAGTLRFDDSPFAPGFFQVMGVAAELAYRMGRDLPPRAEPYAPEEVLDAVASLHPAIEIADTRFMGLNTTDRLSHLADQQSHGALIVGPALADWRGVVPTAVKAPPT